MARPARPHPRDLTQSWPDTPSTSAVGEVARLFSLNLRAAIGERSLRAAATACELSHVTLASILDGRAWPDLETIAKLEHGLQTRLWPTA
ncbi:hypothetical protein EV379_3438 [Microterricola gilva]|uniref:Helix-turn-helix protein n=1 Tax=Microterricola gilva TaxID=393267 RepID=A0A4Q8AQP9_9MICO|nr:hypothetical protein EV379_3438 [Microterricola gilva]